MNNASVLRRFMISLLVAVCMFPSFVSGQTKVSKEKALNTLKSATAFLMDRVSYKGGCL